MLRLTRRELETLTWEFGLRPIVKTMDQPPNPKVGAPVLDPTNTPERNIILGVEKFRKSHKKIFKCIFILYILIDNNSIICHLFC